MKKVVPKLLNMKGPLDAFEPHFIEVTNCMTPQELVFAVWELANRQWSLGYKQGCDDPDFDHGNLADNAL